MDKLISEHNQHYAAHNIEAAISEALTTVNKADRPLAVEELASLDQFHTGGIQATSDLAKAAQLTAKDQVLDVGGGLGGPARFLTQEFGCHVTVIDLTETYCRVGAQLTTLANLSNLVSFQHGNALEMPFADSSFDLVWTQHSTMNIADKPKLYSEIHRVLKPGGRLALYEITAGSGEPLLYPVPWAHSDEMSFLLSPDALHKIITEAGFREIEWSNKTAWAMEWFQEVQKAQQSGKLPPSPLGLHLLLGPDFSAMTRNLAMNIQQGRVRITQGVLERI